LPPVKNFGPFLDGWTDDRVTIAPRRKTPTPRPAPYMPLRRERPPVVIGVPNPYGSSLSAFEPATEVYYEQPAQADTITQPDIKVDPGVKDEPMLVGYDDAYNKVQKERADAESTTAEAPEPTVDFATIGAPTGGGSVISSLHADGQARVVDVINAARTMIGKPYIWGGTTSRGVDCSGLIAFAFRQAGINMPRYRAVDYGKLGAAVDQKSARAGDLVYWDHEGSTDHVGIYLGNGYVIQSPKSGDVTKISKVWGNAQYRRVFNDAAFGQMATPSGGVVTSYSGAPADNVFSPGVSVASPVHIEWRKGASEF
jgi:cell wall-associated NlpC family hydrolase